MTDRTPGRIAVVARALQAEWTKLRSVRSTGLAMLAVVALTLLLSMLSASLSTSDVNLGVLTVDQFHFVHQPMAGDGAVTAQVTSQADSGAWAKAGIMIKARPAAGSPYVALMVTPEHGVLMKADAKSEATKSSATGSRWLRLTRSGQSVTGYESTDGNAWQRVGTLTVADLPSQAEAGLFVASPPSVHVVQLNSHGVTRRDPTLGEATFAHVTVGASTSQATSTWQDTDVTPPPNLTPPTPPHDAGLPYVPIIRGDSTPHSDGSITVKGSGDIGMVGMGGISLADEDRAKASLLGVQFGLIGAVAVGVLYMTSEFKTRTIGITFAQSPRRGTVLAAKATVLAGLVFVTGLVVSVAALLITRPMQTRNGYGPPAYPTPNLGDPAVIRALLGTAVFLALIALLSLALGTIFRRTAGALIVLFTLLVVVPSIAPGISANADAWTRRVTPIAGLSIQQTMTFPYGSSETAISPWTGFAVLCAYTAAALAGAFWLLRRRDI